MIKAYTWIRPHGRRTEKHQDIPARLLGLSLLNLGLDQILCSLGGDPPILSRTSETLTREVIVHHVEDPVREERGHGDDEKLQLVWDAEGTCNWGIGRERSVVNFGRRWGRRYRGYGKSGRSHSRSRPGPRN